MLLNSKIEQEAHGPRRSSEKTTHGYHYVNWKKKKTIIYFIRIEWFLIWTNLNSLYPRMLVPSLVEISPVVLEKMKMWKVYDNDNKENDNDNNNDDGQQTNFDQKSTLEPSAQVS